MTLLKNDGILPLKGTGRIGHFGPAADELNLGDYSGGYDGWHDVGDLSQGFWRTAYGCYALLGALPVGVDSFRDDAPFWNGTAHATAHEIWIEPVSRFLGTLSVYLKHHLYEP